MTWIPDETDWVPAADLPECPSKFGHVHRANDDSTTVRGIEFTTCERCGAKALWVGDDIVAVEARPPNPAAEDAPPGGRPPTDLRREVEEGGRMLEMVAAEAGV